MKKTLGVLSIFVVMCVIATLSTDRFLFAGNLENQLGWVGVYGILAVGVSFVIITGGIDLSIGSVVCLVGCFLPWLLVEKEWSPLPALAFLSGCALLIGWCHGILVTKMKLQPFVVTLCGLLVYRGVARGIIGDKSVGFGTEFKEMRQFAEGEVGLFPLLIVCAAVLLLVTLRLVVASEKFGAGQMTAAAGTVILGGLAIINRGSEFGVSMPFVILLVVVALTAVFLNMTVWGRHLLALGNNEEAARFSGIATDRLVIVAYVICAALAGLGGMLFVMEVGSAQPSSFGNFFELYAIAAAVIGGCSLRGGQGAVLGVVIGTALIVVIKNYLVLVLPKYQNLEFAVIGVVILLGVLGDEVIRRFMERRKLRGWWNLCDSTSGCGRCGFSRRAHWRRVPVRAVV